MSFQDLGRTQNGTYNPSASAVNGEAGYTSAAMGVPSSSQAVATGVYQMNTAVSTFKRLVNGLGTAKDTTELREKIHKSRQYITQLAKETGEKLKDASVRDHSAGVSATQKISDAKLAKDFQSVLQEFERAQRLAAEREAQFVPAETARKRPLGSHGAGAGLAGRQGGVGGAGGSGVGGRAGGSTAQQSRYGLTPMDARDSSSSSSLRDPLLPSQQQRQEVMQVESELAYNEAVIEERAQGIQEIQQQIVEVNEIFQDLAVLVKEQGGMIDDIESHIEGTRAQAVNANKELSKALTSQRESNSFTCWVMAVFAIALFVFFLIMSA